MSLVSVRPKAGLPLSLATAPPQLAAAARSDDRRSGLTAPSMLLEGHDGEVYGTEVSPDGKTVVSGSHDKTIRLWQVYGDCNNWAVLRGHRAAILEVHFVSHGMHIVSASADHTVAVWDVETGTRIKSFGRNSAGHTEAVLGCGTARQSPAIVVSGGDDGTSKVWDLRVKRCVQTFEHRYQITAVTIDDNGDRVFAGSLDNNIMIYDMRKASDGLAEPVCILEGHRDTITGLDLSHDGCRLASNSMDTTVQIWDVRPFIDGSSRLERSLTGGSTHSFEKNLIRVRWSPDDSMIAVGSADRQVYIWCNRPDEEGGPVLSYKLPGHHGSVNEVTFHPTEPIVVSCSSDKKIFLGELEK